MAAVDLVTKADVREYLQVDEDDLPKDALLALLISGISSRVAQRTGAALASDPDVEAKRVFEWTGGVLAIPPCREIAGLEISATPADDDSWEELGSSAWVSEPLDSLVRDRIRFLVEVPYVNIGWGGLGLHRAGNGTPWPRETAGLDSPYAGVRVEAKWGYAPGEDGGVPHHVRLAVLMWIQNVHKRDQAFFSDNVSRAIAEMGIPSDVEELLAGSEPSSPSVTAI